MFNLHLHEQKYLQIEHSVSSVLCFLNSDVVLHSMLFCACFFLIAMSKTCVSEIFFFVNILLILVLIFRVVFMSSNLQASLFIHMPLGNKLANQIYTMISKISMNLPVRNIFKLHKIFFILLFNSIALIL